MNPNASLTRDAAQSRVFTYITESLRFMPPDVTLSTQKLRAASDELSTGYVIRCAEDDGTLSRPVTLGISYWVHGVPRGQESKYLDIFMRSFNQNGWRASKDSISTSTFARGFTRDGYALVAQLDSADGLSLTGYSPCYPSANADVNTAKPSTIPHP